MLGRLAAPGVERYRRFVRDEYDDYLEIRAANYAQEKRWQMRIAALA